MKIPHDLAGRLRAGEIGVLPTDTLYGLAASSLQAEAIERLYEVRGREHTKPCIILISEVSELDRFGVDPEKQSAARGYWPGPISVIVPVAAKEWEYLHRGVGTLAFRVPKPEWLRTLLRETGPLSVPSANPEGSPPATTIEEAKAYFGEDVDFYIDGGQLGEKPSQLISLLGAEPQQLR